MFDQYQGINLNIGYSPENLRALLDAYDIKQATAYRYINRVRSNFERYLLPVSDERHISMHHGDWLKILALVEQVRADKLKQLREKKAKRSENQMRQAAHMMQINELRKKGILKPKQKT